MRWLSYLHPLAMVAVLGLGLLVARAGLDLRGRRLRGASYDRTRHLRLARPFAVVVALGYLSGLASMTTLRNEQLLDSAHAVFTTGALLAIALAAALGRQLQRPAPPPVLRGVHVAAAGLGLLLVLAAAATGWELLP